MSCISVVILFLLDETPHHFNITPTMHLKFFVLRPISPSVPGIVPPYIRGPTSEFQTGPPITLIPIVLRNLMFYIQKWLFTKITGSCPKLCREINGSNGNGKGIRLFYKEIFYHFIF